MLRLLFAQHTFYILCKVWYSRQHKHTSNQMKEHYKLERKFSTTWSMHRVNTTLSNSKHIHWELNCHPDLFTNSTTVVVAVVIVAVVAIVVYTVILQRLLQRLCRCSGCWSSSCSSSSTTLALIEGTWVDD